MECIKTKYYFVQNTTKKILFLFALSLLLLTCSSGGYNSETVQTLKALAKFKTSINDKPFEYLSLIKKQKKRAITALFFTSLNIDYTKLFATKYSAICIVLVAAPFLKLSATIHMFKVFSWLSSRRILPTKTSSFPCAYIGIGYV